MLRRTNKKRIVILSAESCILLNISPGRENKDLKTRRITKPIISKVPKDARPGTRVGRDPSREARSFWNHKSWIDHELAVNHASYQDARIKDIVAVKSRAHRLRRPSRMSSTADAFLGKRAPISAASWSRLVQIPEDGDLLRAVSPTGSSRATTLPRYVISIVAPLARDEVKERIARLTGQGFSNTPKVSRVFANNSLSDEELLFVLAQRLDTNARE